RAIHRHPDAAVRAEDARDASRDAMGDLSREEILMYGPAIPTRQRRHADGRHRPPPATMTASSRLPAISPAPARAPIACTRTQWGTRRASSPIPVPVGYPDCGRGRTPGFLLPLD